VEADRAGGAYLEVNRSLTAFQIWLALLVACFAVAALSFVFLDLPIARWSSSHLGKLNTLGAGLGSAVLLSLEALVALAMIATRLMRGRLSPLGEAFALASLTSMCAYAANDGVLKLFFGVPNPTRVLLEGAHHTFHILAGAGDSSFPSGHMVLAASFGGVFMRLFPSSIWALSLLLSFGAGLLIFGDWHFASDVIVGAFAGLSVGILAGELWRVHSKSGATAL
jgi:membrane-associated phospholipid phosphatase